MAVVTCVKYHLCSGCVGDAQGYGRLIKTDGTVLVSQIPNEGFLTSANFSVSNSSGKETRRWDNGKAATGYQVQFRPDETLSYAGPESTYTLTWHQESFGDNNVYKVTDFNTSNPATNVAGYSGAKNVPGRGTYWIWFKQDYFQKEGYGCKEIALPAGSKGNKFRCVFFAKFFMPPLTGVRYSFTWVYDVFQNEEPVGAQMDGSSMQCADPNDCANAMSIDGLTIKAADYAKCGFTNPDEATNPLNPKVVTAGTDINVRCDWDHISLKYGAIEKWEQGMADAPTMTGDMMKKIRTEGYPNNSHIRTYPFSCLAGMGRQGPETKSTKMNWTFIILTCDQQFNGMGTYHKLSMSFKLNKDMRRRRLENSKGNNKEGDEGSFGYNMKSGKCIKADKDDKSCAQYETDGEGGFALLFSLLALFALY